VRLQTFLFLCVGPLLIACAYQGTIVQKAGQPLPYAYSLGIDASYKFALRDRLGHIRWQLVSAEVFNSYRVGDYFNDESPTPPRHRRCSTDGKEVLCLPVHETIPISVPRFQPIPLEPRAVSRLNPDASARGR
jgi:hypothetical protein